MIMDDAIKVFIGLPAINGYVDTGATPWRAQFQFNANIDYHMVIADTVVNDTENWQYNAEIGDSPGTIYSALYTQILSKCAANSYPTPHQNDIFCYIPVALSQIFVEIPSLA
jgi:hypothetical protein